MTIRRLKTAAEVIDAIGRSRVMELTGKLSTHVSNWLARGNFPAETFLIMTSELEKLECCAPPKLWRQIERSKRAA